MKLVRSEICPAFLINHIIRLVDVYDNIHRCLDTYHVWWYTGGNDKRKVRIIRQENKEMIVVFSAGKRIFEAQKH